MRSFAVNIHGPFMLSHMVLKDMVPRKSGSIVNISSGAAIGPGRGPYKTATVFRGGVCYGAEKAALERFTQGLAEEVYDDGISVTCVSPSQVVATPGAVDLVGALHRALVVRDHDKLRARLQLGHQRGERCQAELVERSVDFVHHAEGAGVEQEQREDQRHRGQCLLTA